MMNRPDNYTPYHVHSMLSNGVTNIDSITDFHKYIDEAKELNMRSFGFSEHGSLFQWLKKKEYIESCGMKYIHAIEVYLTETDQEKIRDNYHCVLIAKNYDGVKELNKIVSKSFNRRDNHFYYTPRVTFDELFNTSDNIIMTSACLASALNNATPMGKEKYLGFMVHNKHRCFLEIQHHNCEEQIKYNKLLYEISKNTGIPLIAGTDTHEINNEFMFGRAIMQKSKDIHFDNEDAWDLAFKTLDELIEAYKEQNALPIEIVYEAIENTNRMADMVEPFEIDYSPKYPKLYANSEEVFKRKINEGFIDRGINKYPDSHKYINRIHNEYDVYKHNNAIDLMLLEEDYKSAMRKQGIRYGYSRGSVSGSIIAYLLHITEIDSIKFNLNFERFMNKERVSLADIDTDWYSEDRNAVREYLYNKEGLYCCDIITFNTDALKGTIKDVCRGLAADNIDKLPKDILLEVKAWDKQENNAKKQLSGYEKKDYPLELQKKIEENSVHKEVPFDHLSFANEVIEIAEENEELARERYPELFYYVDMINGVVISVGNHPAGCVVSPFPVDEFFGTFTTSTNEYPISLLNMKEIDSLNFVKLDILGLDNVGLIYKTCELAGIPYATPDNIPLDDEDVWMSIKDDTTMIFQWESETATTYLQQLLSEQTVNKIKETNDSITYMDLLSIGNGAIRPAGESYRNKLLSGEFNDCGHPALNEMMASTQGFMVFQEEIITFLNKFCGYTMGEADVVRRCIAEDSEVLLSNGKTKKIQDIKIGDEVLNFDEHDVIDFKPDIVQNVYDNGMQTVYKISAPCGYELYATSDHKILTKRGWLRVNELTTTDYIMTSGIRSYMPVISIKENEIKHVYDLEIKDRHNYIANGIVVHNCFAKKYGTEEHIPKIKDGFIKTMQNDYNLPVNEAEKIIVNFLKVIEDASDYLFSSNHSIPYSCIGYICGYLRYYYPIEFITSALNIFKDNKDKSAAIIKYAKKVGIKIVPIKFRHSMTSYSFNKEDNLIYKGISSIKYMNEAIAGELFELKDNEYNSFIDLLYDIADKTSLDKRQLTILIELNFFVEFGDANYLLELMRLHEKFSKRKQFNKADIANLGIEERDIVECCDKVTEKTYSKLDSKKLIYKLAKNIHTSKRTIKEVIRSQIEYLGYIDIVDDQYKNIVVVLSIDTKYSPRLECYSLKNGKTFYCKIDKRTFNNNKLKKIDIIKIKKHKIKEKVKRTSDGQFVKIPGTSEIWLKDYEKVL